MARIIDMPRRTAPLARLAPPAESVQCPALGDAISRYACRQHQARPFAGTNPSRVALAATCPVCPNRRK